MSIGTLFDAGWSVSTKALLVVLLPGPVLLVEGKADLFKVPTQLGSATEEGTLSLLAALDGRAGTLELGIDAAWELARVLDIAAGTEAFFDFDRPDAWHLWIGQETPNSARIRADVLALFHADAWLMLDAGGIASGLGVSWGDSWKFGPVRLTLSSWIEARAALSRRPAQLSGSLSLGGEMSVHTGPFGIGIAVEAGLDGQSLTPYLVAGTLSVVVELPKPFKDLDLDVGLEWRSDASQRSRTPGRRRSWSTNAALRAGGRRSAAAPPTTPPPTRRWYRWMPTSCSPSPSRWTTRPRWPTTRRRPRRRWRSASTGPATA